MQASSCFPWQQPTTQTLRSSAHKVFAHYFSPYPISLDNAPAASDYYTTQYLAPDGENGIHLSYGGLLRDRPLSRATYSSSVDYHLADLETEVRRAIAIGLDGFSYDVMATASNNANMSQLLKLLQATAAVDSAFKVLLVPDMSSGTFGGGGGTDSEALSALETLLAQVSSSTSLMRTSDGRIVLAPFDAEARSASFWSSALTTLKAKGYSVALMPMTVSGSWNDAAFNSVPLYGAASWGVRTAGDASALATGAAAAHADNLVWMAPVAFQDSRPRDFQYTEAGNTAAFRAQWQSVINSNADWVQLVTWNDYSENTHIAPSEHTQTSIYNLTAYYIAWLKTGQAPAVSGDALYYYYRAHSMNTSVATPNLHDQLKAFTSVESIAPSDQVEVVAFLSSSATVEIKLAGNTYQYPLNAGMHVLDVPLQQGTPSFSIVRDGATVVQATGATQIDNSITYQDPLYQGGVTPYCAPPT